MTNQPEQIRTSTSWRAWRRAWWWALGTAACATPTLAAVWNPSEDLTFNWAFAVAAIAGAIASRRWNQRRAGWMTPSLLVAAAFPICVALGLTLDAILDGTAQLGLTVKGFAVVVPLAALPIALRLLPKAPRRALRWAAIVWTLVCVITLPLYLLGFFASPEAVSLWFASRAAPERKTS